MADPHISYATWHYMRHRIEQLESELYRANLAADYWYAAANHTPEELREQYLARSKGLDENGDWIWPNSMTN